MANLYYDTLDDWVAWSSKSSQANIVNKKKNFKKRKKRKIPVVIKYKFSVAHDIELDVFVNG